MWPGGIARPIADKPISLDDLKPAPWNPRKISPESLAALTASMGEFGDLAGLTWNKRSGQLIAGHQRLRALREKYGKRLKLEDGAVVTPDGQRFPVRIVDLDEAHEKAANVAANSPELAGMFTPDLSGILDGLKIELPDLSKLLRFDELTIPDFLAPEITEDEPPAMQEGEAVTQPGELLELGKHRVLCGDCTVKENVERLMGGQKAESAIYDPPWDLELPVIELPKSLLCFSDGYRIGDIVSRFGPPTWLFVWDCVASWYTPNRPLRRMKLCCWYGDLECYQENGAHFGESGEPHMVQNPRGKYLYHPDKRGKHLSDVFVRALPQMEKDHQHEKPLDWLRCLLGNCTTGLIYDPFLGSGTALIAAEQLGRVCYGCELEPHYCDVIVRRWLALMGDKAPQAWAKRYSV